MQRLKVFIRQVENGYEVHEDDPERRGIGGKTWVANDIPELTDLVGELAAATEISPLGVRPEPVKQDGAKDPRPASEAAND